MDAEGKWTGNYISKPTVVHVSAFGQAAQVQKLDLCAQLCEAKRKSVTRKLSGKEVAAKVEQKAKRASGREASVAALSAAAAAAAEVTPK